MEYDAIIIGGGIIGLATAERLLKSGRKIKLLERGRIGQEASWAGGGILSPLCPWNYSDAVTCLTQYSARFFSTWTSTLHEATGIDPEYNRCGMLILPPYDLDEAALWCNKNQVEICQKEISIPYSAEKGANITRHEKIKQAIFLPDIAQIRNPRLLRALHQHVIQLGGKIRENCTVYDLKIKRDKVISLQTSCGTFVADHFIVAAGAWSKAVLGKHALDLEIWPIKGQMLLFKFDETPLPAILVKDNVYLIPRKDGHLLIGSTIEDTGFSKQISISAQNRLLAEAQTILPQLQNMSIIRQWSGLRPASLENIPTISQHPLLANLFINSGHFRYGVTMAPASAEILTNIINGTAQPIDIHPFQSGWMNRKPSN